MATTVAVREREDGDLSTCASLLLAVHEADGYPLHLPGDPVSFLSVPDALGAWVAVVADAPVGEAPVGEALVGEALVGHVLLRPAANPKMMVMASDATGLPEQRLAVVGRLFVTPSARRRGVGRALLARAARHAWALGRQPVLDVVAKDLHAIALYEREGWRKAGSVRVTFHGTTIDELVFVGPAGRSA